MVAGILNQNVPNQVPNNVPSMSGNVSNYSMMGAGANMQGTPSHFDGNKRKKLREMIFGVK